VALGAAVLAAVVPEADLVVVDSVVALAAAALAVAVLVVGGKTNYITMNPTPSHRITMRFSFIWSILSFFVCGYFDLFYFQILSITIYQIISNNNIPHLVGLYCIFNN
jgi:hypothetical protein